MFTLLGLQADDSIIQALDIAGHRDAYDLAMKSEEIIEALISIKLDRTTGTIVHPVMPLHKLQQGALKVMGMFLRKLQVDNDGEFNDDIILSTNQKAWNNFHVRVPIVNEATVDTTSSSQSSPITDDDIKFNNVMKGIKRKKTHYTTLKDIKDFDAWQRSFLAIADSHKNGNIFDNIKHLSRKRNCLINSRSSDSQI
jgi:hypothetical protein